MQEGLSRMQAQLAPLEQEVAILKKANLDLQTENEALKRQAAAQAQKLSLKNREVEDLKAKNRDQEETLSRLQAELNQGKTKHSQLRDLFQEASAANQQVQIECRADNEALKGQLGKLQEAQQNSAQALSEKEREVEELQSELTASKEQNKEIEKLRQQLEQTNAKLAAAQQENVARQAEIDATKKAHLVGQEQLEALRVDLDRSLENQGRSVRELAQIHLEAEQLKSTLAKAEGKVEKLEAELTASRNRAEELERKNAAEKQRLEQELSKLRSQLELAEKTNATSQEKIEKLGESLVQKTKELEAQKRATESAQEAAKQAEHSLQEQKSLSQSETKRMQLELDRVEKAYEGVAENWKQSEKALAELKKTSRQKEEELNKQIALLDKHYAELTHQRTEELELHYALDTEQQQIITELEANLASLRLQNKDLEKIEQLQKELEGAKLQQKEAAQAKDSSDRLYKAQKKELKRRNKELEAELLRLKDKLTLNERMLKQQTASVPTEDLREKMPLPKTPITSSPKTIFLPVNNSNEMNQIDQTLQNIEQAMKTLDATETISPLWVGPIVINMAFLDGRLPGDRPTWISGKFEDELDAEELKRVDKSLTVHYEPLIARAYKEKNVHTVAGDLTKALRHEAIVALQKPDHFKTLESCFGEKLFIVKCLKEAKTQLKPIIAQYQTLGDKDPNRQSKFERASQLTVQIDQVLEVIGQKLNQHKWKIRA
ncbi:MAG: hypothetical protein KBA81_06815 [Rhabdochlamydiaceae bacterium]|nr:hypothetical protein [Rhabdochlamydiaceae bacterium]